MCTNLTKVMLIVSAIVACGATALADQSAMQRIVLRRGDVLWAPVLDQSDHAVTIDHPVLGKVTVDRSQIASMEPAKPAQNEKFVATETDEVATTQQVERAASNQQDEEDAKSKPKGPSRLFAPWQLQVSAGFSGAWGNRESYNVFTRVRAKEQTKEDRWKIELSYFTGRSRGHTTQNEFRANVQKDWLLPDSPWFWFVQGEYEHDQLEAWRHRVGGYSGLGYTFKDWGPDITLRLGGGVNSQFGGQQNGVSPESLFGGGLEWQINRNHKLAVNSNFYPSVGPVGNLRIDTSADWTMKLDPTSGLALTVGLKNEYDSEVPPGYKNSDTKLFAGLTVDF